MPEGHPSDVLSANAACMQNGAQEPEAFLPYPTRSPRVTGIRGIDHPPDGARIAERRQRGKAGVPSEPVRLKVPIWDN